MAAGFVNVKRERVRRVREMRRRESDRKRESERESIEVYVVAAAVACHWTV